MTIAPTTEKLITGEEFLPMSDIGPCARVHGRIVPSEGVLAGFMLPLVELFAA